MATNPSVLPDNSGRITAPTTAYPYGSAKQDTTGTAGDGTPFSQALLNDDYGFKQWLLGQAGIVPSGTADTALVSQYGEALQHVVSATKKPTMVLQETNAGTGTFVTIGTGYRQRRINTVVQNDIVGASLLSHEVTLPQGKYQFNGYFGYQAVNDAFEHIYNVTDAQYESGLQGSSAGSNDSSFLKGYVEITEQKVFSSYGYLSDAGNTGVNATPVSLDNIYACLIITKVG